MEEMSFVSPLCFLNIIVPVSTFLNTSRTQSNKKTGLSFGWKTSVPSTFILVDCTWSEFGEYSRCSVSCGQGIQTSVKLLNHAAQNGGKTCEEDTNILRNTKICSNPKCKDSKITSNMIYNIFKLIELIYNSITYILLLWILSSVF